MSKLLTTADFAAMKCAACEGGYDDPEHGHDLYLHAACHPEATLHVRVTVGGTEIVTECGECNKPVCRIAIGGS